MKKNILKGYVDLFTALKSNNIKPNSSEDVNLRFAEDILRIKIENDNCDAGNCYLVAFDKKNDVIINIQKVIYENGEVIVDFREKCLSEKIGGIIGFKYARLCLAMSFKDEYAFFYLNKEEYKEQYNDINSYVGVINENREDSEKKLMLYFSAAGQLSIKFVSNEEYYGRIVSYTLTSVFENNNIINIAIDGYGVEGKEIRLAWRSKTTGKIVESIPVSIDKIEELGMLRRRVLATMNLRDITCSEQDSYYLVYIMGDYICDVKISQDIGENMLFERIYSVDHQKQIAFVVDSDDKLDMQLAEKIFEYMFSIIVAVYNTESYLEEAINSVLHQDISKLNKYLIGNESDIYNKRIYRNIFELIIVDDGSKDGSLSVCKKYAAQYKNIVLISFDDNKGVSYARNRGIDISRGKYLNFMDSDDRISDNMLTETFHFFEEHYEEMEALSVPSYFFDGEEGEHWLNGKFEDGNRIINLWEYGEASLVFVNSTVYKGEKVRKKEVIFDTELVSSEDIKFNYQLLMKYGARIGVLNKCVYWYRRRSGGELSAVQTHKLYESYYTTYIEKFVMALIEESYKNYGCVAKFIQHVIMQQFQWRVIEDAEGYIGKKILGKEGYAQYSERLLKMLGHIDDDVIMAQRKLFIEHKAFLLMKKYTKYPRKEYYNNDIILYYGNIALTCFSKLKTQIDVLRIEDGRLKIEGTMNFLDFKEDIVPEIFLICDNVYVKCNNVKRKNERWSLGERIMISQGFCGEIDISKVQRCEIQIGHKEENINVIKKNIKFSRRAPINITYKNAYYAEEKWVVKYKKGSFFVENVDIQILNENQFEYEKLFLDEIIKNANGNKSIEKAVDMRKKYMDWRMLNFGKRKPIWLISDRYDEADDNGEVFFWYMIENHFEDVECYFVIDKNSKDYSRLKKSGRVLEYDSDKHKLIHLMADVIISSQGNEYITNPFYLNGMNDIFRDITYRHKYIFLQHGVIKDDLSKWLNRYEKNINGFVTSAKLEYDSIVSGDYFYSEKEVWLTGLPRYDLLYHNEKNVITVMPTWRRYILSEDKKMPGKFHVMQGFESTAFYEFYNGLFNDAQLIEALQKYDYIMAIKMHPLLEECIDKFKVNERVKFYSSDVRYVDIFAEAKLLLTDYSSTAMDFAYLNKPLIYAQFDEEEFFSGEHTYEKGYFDYNRDGFGEVVYDRDECVKTIIEYMQTECAVKEKYSQRIKEFFRYRDKNNCERVYTKIVEII